MTATIDAFGTTLDAQFDRIERATSLAADSVYASRSGVQPGDIDVLG